ncbi:hypothetical protein EDF28_3558 [Curtobacterium sp. PhB137]|nr:hypothetical protein EDF28_3558 [Curtobacterium sp. PhB137]TDW42346.1 hypothetical protein EDF52_11539 [Curtobacterium sp. PhB42]TDW52872.1 hypothetical protein EDF47_11239 [Curtobacterium sp. PhB190]
MDATAVIWTIVIAAIALVSLSAGGWGRNRSRRHRR